MPNPNWKKGMTQSPNPEGRRRMKHSAKTIKGSVERFLAKVYTPRKMKEIHDGLNAKGKLEMFDILAKYVLPRQAELSISKYDNLSTDDLRKLRDSLIESITVADVTEPDKEPVETLLLNPANFSRYGTE